MVLALRQWGEDWGHGTQEMLLADQRDGKPVRAIRVLAEDGRELELHELMWVDRATGATFKRDDGRLANGKGRPRRGPPFERLRLTPPCSAASPGQPAREVYS